MVGRWKSAAPCLREILIASAVALCLLLWQGWRLGAASALWLTPQQRGWLAFVRKDYESALALFEDPLRMGAAAERMGRYAQAAQAYGRVDSAPAHFNRGNALLRSREYAQAIVAYEQALAMAPQWIEAQENLALARHISAYLAQQREASDAGEERQPTPEDTRYDGSEERGREIEIRGDSPMALESAEKWMRTVDTDARDFLRRRFLLEARTRDRD